MNKVKRFCLISAIAIILMIVIPMAVSAASGGDALAGLKEFYAFLIQLASKGLEGYIEFLKALV